MRTSYQNPEERDDKASNFWANLTTKLGVSVPVVKTASVKADQFLSDGIQTHGERQRPQGMIRTAAVVPMKDQDSESDRVMDMIAVNHLESTGDLSQEERVKVTDRLSRICNDMTSIRSKANTGGGGDQKTSDIYAEIGVKADAVSGSCTQLKDKAGEMSVAQAKAIENVFLLLSDAKTVLDEKAAAPTGPLHTAPDMTLMNGELSDAPPTDEEPLMDEPVMGSPRARMQREAQVDLYEDLRCVYTKINLAASMLDEIVADLNVGAMLPGPEMPKGPEIEGDGAPEKAVGSEEKAGKELFDEMEHDHLTAAAAGVVKTAARAIRIPKDFEVQPLGLGENPPGKTTCGTCGLSWDDDKITSMTPAPSARCPFEHFHIPEAEVSRRDEGLGGTASVKTAASGDPGDTEPGNSVYKDISKCRDCVWFESDHTHETYRDKCKNCVHAKMSGTTNHWWPRSQQMVIWAPEWGAPEASENKVRLSFQDTLSLKQAAPTQAASISREIVASFDMDEADRLSMEWFGKKYSDLEDDGVKQDYIAHLMKSAVSLGKAMITALQNPLLVSQMPRLARAVAAEIEALTGVAVSRAAGEEGMLIVAYPQDGFEHEAKGERAKIRVLRIQLEGETDAVKIKAIKEAIDALEDRMDKDKKSKEERRKQREDKRQKAESDAKIDAAVEEAASSVAGFKGTLCLAAMNGGMIEEDECSLLCPECLQYDDSHKHGCKGKAEPRCPYCLRGLGDAHNSDCEEKARTEYGGGQPSGTGNPIASLRGSLCLADAMQWPSASPELGPGEEFQVCPKCNQKHATNVPCPAQAAPVAGTVGRSL